jgi:hypothetical protein
MLELGLEWVPHDRIMGMDCHAMSLQCLWGRFRHGLAVVRADFA